MVCAVTTPLHRLVGYIKVLQTTTSGTNLTSEAISPGCKTLFAINEKILYLRKMC